MEKIYQVFVIGMRGEKKTIDVANSEEEFNNMTVRKFKEKLAEKLPQEASDLSALRLLYTSKQLNDSDRFSGLGIKDKATICIIFRLPDEMKTKVDTAVLKQFRNLDSAVQILKRCSSWPLLRQIAAFSDALFQTPSASGDSSAVNQMVKDIKKMKIEDRVSHALDERLTAEPRPANQDPCPYRGLLNPGAMCFLNAVLQALFMTDAFRDRVLLAPGDTSEKLVSALKEIFAELGSQDGDAPSVSTEAVIKALGIQRVYEQQDAVEYFLDILEKAGPSLAEVFRGTMRNNRVCSEDHESHDDSSFKSIQIALNSRDGPCRLEDDVRSYFESTTLDGDDQMYCDLCKKKSDTIWSCEIHEYPTILALHLKRFVYDYRCYGFVKNHCPMDVPLHLSLQEQEYCLYAVINHSGSLFGGHYTAVSRSFTDDKWYCFDDSRVTETDESRLKRSREAYLLLYQKLDGPPASETRKETQNVWSDAQVNDGNEEPKTKTAETECSGAHSTPQLEVSAVLRETVEQNDQDKSPYYIKKPQKRECEMHGKGRISKRKREKRRKRLHQV